MTPRSGIDPARWTKLVSSLSSYRDDMIRSLALLCAIPSVKGPATPIAPYGEQTRLVLETFLDLGRRLGFKAVNLDNRAGYLEFGAGPRLTAALCHLDVVPAGDDWALDAFRPAVMADRIIGRGTSDDKGPAIAVLYAMKALMDGGLRPDGRIRLIVGLDEESGSSCMEHYVRVAELPDAGFTPDAGFPVVYAEKGLCWADILVDRVQPTGDLLRLTAAEAGLRPNVVPGRCRLEWTDAADRRESQTIDGVPAHASMPWDGCNAIGLAMQAADARLTAAGCHHPFVDFYRQAIGMDWDGRGFRIDGADESGPLTLNAGILRLNEQTARLTLDIRYPVTLPYGLLVESLNRRAEELGARAIIDRQQPPLYLARNSALVETLSGVYRDLTGLDTEPTAIGGGTYARTMPNIVAFGPSFPGAAETAHQAGEFILIDDLMAAAEIYRQSLLALAALPENRFNG